MRRSKNFRRACVESLEGRQLMAGDVIAALEGNLLVIEGDNLDNQITVSQLASGDVVVSGQTGTLINGLPSVRYVRPALNSVEIRMEGGNDVVNLRSVQIANDLMVDLGAGNDRVTSPAAAPIRVSANAMVYGAEGNDTVQLNGSTVAEDLFIDGGLGALTAQLNNVTVDKVMSIIGDEANDLVSVVNSRIGLVANIETKGGSDRVTMVDFSALGLQINTDANGSIGADQVTLTRVQTVEDLNVATGSGNDVVAMTDVTSGKSIAVILDEGNDSLTATRVSAAVDAILDGGAGVDTLTNRGVFAGITREIKDFEILR